MPIDSKVTNTSDEGVLATVRTELKSFGDDVKSQQEMLGKEYAEL